jgi:hypothetical protein
VRAGDASHIGQPDRAAALGASQAAKPDIRGAGRSGCDTGLDDDKAAAACVFLPNDRQARFRVLMRPHDHVLEELAETGFHRPLVARLDFQGIGKRPHLTDAAVGPDQHHPRRVAVEPGAVRVELFGAIAGGPSARRAGARANARRARHSCSMRVASSGFTRGACVARRLQRFVRHRERVLRAGAGGDGAIVLGPEIRCLGVETLAPRRRAHARRGGFERRGQRGDRVHHRVDVRARRVHRLLGDVDG